MRYLVWVMTLLAASSAAAEEKGKVAVLDIQATGIEADLVPTLTEILTVEVDKIGTYKVIAGRDIQTMLGFEKQKDIIGCTDASCLAEIGGALGVDRIIASQIGKIGSTYVVNIKLINIRMADTENRVYETVRGEVDALIDTIRRSARKLLGAPLENQAPVAQQAAPTPKAIVAPQPSPVEPPVATAEAQGSSGRRIGWLPITLWGVGGVAAVVGTVMGIQAKNAESDANRQLPSLSDGTPVYEAGAQAAAEDAKLKSTIANVNFAISAVALGGGFLAYYLSGDKPAATAFVPVVSPQGVGLAVEGRF